MHFLQEQFMIKKSTKEIPAFVAGDATLIKEILHPKNQEVILPYSIAHATLDPGKSSLPHILRSSSEVYYILSGKGKVVIDGVTQAVETGDLVFIPAGARQELQNDSSAPITFLCIVAPPWNKEDERVF